jgi:outer membrane protein OmpA-like peptidoglycan-associated protein
MFFTKAALKSYQEEFKLGKRNLINILDAENEYQNARSNLARTKYDLLLAKYRVLYSQGTLVEDLNLHLPYADKLKKLKNLRASVRDELPYVKNIDKDKLICKGDLSANSNPGDELDDLGAEVVKSKLYFRDPSAAFVPEDARVIKNRRDLQRNKIKIDEITRLSFVSFERNTIELSAKSKQIMREVVEQLKGLSMEGMIQITVHTSEKSTLQENTLLALERAYNLKKILTTHNIEADSIQVFAGQNKDEKERSSIYIKVVTEVKNFRKAYEPIVREKIRFRNNYTKLTDEAKTETRKLAEELKRLGNNHIDVVVYSNDYDNASRNQKIASKRAGVIADLLQNQGVAKVNPIGWGEYPSSPSLYDSTDEVQVNNRVEFVIRN